MSAPLNDYPVTFMCEPLTDANRDKARTWAELEFKVAFEELARIGGAALLGDEVKRIELPFAVRRAARAERLVFSLRVKS